MRRAVAAIQILVLERRVEARGDGICVGCSFPSRWTDCPFEAIVDCMKPGVV